MAKLVRLSAVLQEEPELDSSRKFPFLLLDGLIADFIPWMKAGGTGSVSGIPNFAPRTSARLWHLCSKSKLTDAEAAEASRLQAVLSRADAAAVPAGVRGMSEFTWSAPSLS